MPGEMWAIFISSFSTFKPDNYHGIFFLFSCLAPGVTRIAKTLYKKLSLMFFFPPGSGLKANVQRQELACSGLWNGLRDKSLGLKKKKKKGYVSCCQLPPLLCPLIKRGAKKAPGSSQILKKRLTGNFLPLVAKRSSVSTTLCSLIKYCISFILGAHLVALRVYS